MASVAQPAVARIAGSTQTARIRLAGRVQGVGFRPFVYRLAHRHDLRGSVQNQLGEVVVLVQGAPAALASFQRELIELSPPLAEPSIVAVKALELERLTGFEIVPSSSQAPARVAVPADLYMCADCAAELADPGDRRYRYPFINCTQCGPRYTLVEAMPYDRVNTSMAAFALCADCRDEYRNPSNRRFHAEPVACPRCGPQIALHAAKDDSLGGDAALRAAVGRLQQGQVIAVKGIGGYHLMCDARSAAAVARLRRRKHRPDKPLAVVFPVVGDDGLDAVRSAVQLSAEEAALLQAASRPIVLARKLAGAKLADNLAPKLAELGVFLPYSPLHQLLVSDFGAPLVVTSGNLSGEPVMTANNEAELRLGAVADAFLHHNRPIVRPADDSVFRQIDDAPRPLRLGRGVTPLELKLGWPQQQPLLALAGHAKATVTLAWGRRLVVSPHIGRIDNPRSVAVLESVAADLQSLYAVRAERLVADAHPGYGTHRWAQRQSLPLELVWHHHAHASALVAETVNAGADNWLVFTWDAAGLGEDGTLWGGEALLGGPGRWRRVGSMRPFRLPGGEQVARQPWRSAAALAWETGHRLVDEAATELVQRAWRRNLNCVESSAVGRLFDAAAALVLGIRQTSFEAQAPMQFEALCRGAGQIVPLPLVRAQGMWRSDWEPLFTVLSEAQRGAAERAEIFHSSLAAALVAQARRIRAAHQVDCVGLAGGVFQNRTLTEQASGMLREAGFEVCLPTQLPSNDAALGVGQAIEVAARDAFNAE